LLFSVEPTYDAELTAVTVNLILVVGPLSFQLTNPVRWWLDD